MKRRDLVKLLERNGWRLVRTGGNHDIYSDGVRFEPIPRHRDINEKLSKVIIRRCGLEEHR